MSLGAFLQLLGAGLELLGLGTVAWGIAETRQKFTDRPSLARRGWARTQRFAARFRKKRPKEVILGVGSSRLGHFSSKGRLTVSLGPWDHIPPEERIERLKRRVEEHDSLLSRLDERIDTEETARSGADEAQGRKLTELQEDFSQAIRDAVAGGIRLESIGVGLFTAGIILGTWGNILS